MKPSNSVMKNITTLLGLSSIVVLLLVIFSLQNYSHSKILLYDYLTRKAVSISLLYEAKARQDMESEFPAPPTEIVADKDIYSLYVFDRNKKVVMARGKNFFDINIVEKSLITQQLLSYQKYINGEPYWIVTMPFHLGDKRYYATSQDSHQPKFKVLALAIPITVGNSIIFPAKIQLLLSLSLFVFFVVISYWQWKSIRSYIAMQKILLEKESLAQIGMTAARLAHEIRNPLAGIKGLAQLLEEDDIPITSKSYLSSIINETNRLNNIISELLEYSRKKQPAFNHFLLYPTAEEARNCYANEIKNKQIYLEIDIPQSTIVYADKNLFLRLLHNLLANAIEAVPYHGKISVTSQSHTNYIFIIICNNGEVILQENIEKIFYPFFSTKTKGTGLGLSICKQIMAAHNGDISVVSNSEVTCFKLSFPKAV